VNIEEAHQHNDGDTTSFFARIAFSFVSGRVIVNGRKTVVFRD